tara:strand:+ start:365 stop:982 length:618 start_codon:yes stop_codon:yes gene_type:complete
MSAAICQDHNRVGNTTGEILFETVDARNNKMAVMIRRIFPSKFRRSQYIGLQMDGQLDGAVVVSAPSVYNVRCGEKPVDGCAAITYAENGDIILYAPRGRVRIMAQDIDLLANGNGADTGFVNINSNSTIDIDSGEVRMKAGDAIGIAAERNVNINSGQVCKVSSGNFKVIETPDVSPITSFAGSGSMSPIQYAEAFKKLLQSLL